MSYRQEYTLGNLLEQSRKIILTDFYIYQVKNENFSWKKREKKGSKEDKMERWKREGGK